MPCMSIMGGAAGGAVKRVSTMPRPSIMACVHCCEQNVGRRATCRLRACTDATVSAQGKASCNASQLSGADRQLPDSECSWRQRRKLACKQSHVLTSRMPPASADLAADAGPVLRDKKPPVSAPALMEFQGSSCSKLPNSAH